MGGFDCHRWDTAAGGVTCGTSRAALRLLVGDSMGATRQEKHAAGLDVPLGGVPREDMSLSIPRVQHLVPQPWAAQCLLESCRFLEG